MANDEEPGGELLSRPPSNPRSDPVSSSLLEASDADLQEQERPWGSDDAGAGSERLDRLGLETPEADALEQSQDWGGDDDEAEFRSG